MKLLRSLLAAAVLALAPVQALGACWEWSKTAASNATADLTINWAEGQSPSSVNDSARAMMARIAECRDDLSGALTTGGTATAYTLTTNQANIAATPGDGQQVVAKVHVTNGSSATLAVDGGTAFPLRSAAATAAPASTFVAGMPYRFTFSSSASAWLLQNFYPTSIGAGTITTTMLSDNAVTYAKMQTVTNNRVLGNFSGATAAPSEYSLTGASVSGTAITFPFPPTGVFRNLVIKVTGNTGGTVAADYVTTTNGSGGFQTTAVSCTLNFGTTGINALDTGSIASATWYYIWVNVKSDGTTGCTASLQSTANATFLSNLPATYTYYARVGAMRTAAGSAQLLGTWQFGRRAQYVMGLAQTTIAPNIDNGAKGTYSNTSPVLATASVSSVVPSTASAIYVVAYNRWKNGTASSLYAAPNTSWGGTNNGAIGSAGQAWPIFMDAASNQPSISAMILLESTNIAWASNQAGAAISCAGWEDNL